MRALTLTQPWAGLIASGIKLIENRPRSIVKREDFGKPFAIHASRLIDEPTYERIGEIDPDLDVRRFERFVWDSVAWYRMSRITSAVIAVATIDRVVHSPLCGYPPDESCDECAALARDLDDQYRWFFGAFGYVLRDVRAVAEPVPCRGFQGFWTLPADVAARVEAQL